MADNNQKLSTARQDALNDAFRIYGDNPAKLMDFIAWVNASHQQQQQLDSNNKRITS